MIEGVIRSLLASRRWRKQRPYDINNGDCEDFQQDVCAAISNAQERVTENYPSAARMAGHCWIYYRGRHYDAEAPRGVDRWQRLPIFARALRRLARPPTGRGEEARPPERERVFEVVGDAVEASDGARRTGEDRVQTEHRDLIREREREEDDKRTADASAHREHDRRHLGNEERDRERGGEGHGAGNAQR